MSDYVTGYKAKRIGSDCASRCYRCSGIIMMFGLGGPAAALMEAATLKRAWME